MYTQHLARLCRAGNVSAAKPGRPCFQHTKISYFTVVCPRLRQTPKPHPVKNFLSCFLIKFQAFMLTSSCFHTHAFILSCFMSSCSRFHASFSCLPTLILSAHALIPSCSCHHVPTGGSHLTAKLYHWSLHPHDHVHVCQAAPR